MNAPRFWRVIPALLVAGSIGFAYAKLPAPPAVDPAKAEAAKMKAAEAAKKGAEALAKAQDRVVERYKKEKGIKTAATAPAPKKK
ncbi:MAG: formate dehydrogenase [Betaproteobacteria bacterium]|nr:formate dehydrogenase [Betaproteobacteria bacterium]